MSMAHYLKGTKCLRQETPSCAAPKLRIVAMHQLNSHYYKATKFLYQRPPKYEVLQCIGKSIQCGHPASVSMGKLSNFVNSMRRSCEQTLRKKSCEQT